MCIRDRFHTATVQGHTAFFSEEWMKNGGVDKAPETTDELYDMLVAFKEQDANGNGDPSDEIPFKMCIRDRNTAVMQRPPVG